jgi:hypothetical protein
MKYLYIPTSTLNFNNILSTGSISPAAVYATRRFGYNKFEVVPPNPFQNTLLLYDRYPVFSVMDADRDNFPLVIRIRANRLFDANQAIQDITVYDKTIYLDPATTEFLFTTQEAKKIALMKTEPSLTTKLVGLYQTGMKVVNFEQVDSFNWSREILDNISDGSSEVVLRNCESDARINRLKGFVCGYILGAYKSLDEKIAKYRSVIKEQRNEVSAMLNDPSRGNQERLRRALESCTTLDDLWSAEGIGRRRFELEQGDRIINDRGQIAALEYRHESDHQSSLLLIKLFNTYCLSSDFTGQLDESRFNVAMDGAKAIKNLIGSEWEGSPNQTYINDLLNNIKSGSPFDFNLSNSLALKSFAAFVQKGDDLDKLETFLVDQGVGDFRIAFALWGAMFGFSKIPKTVYNLPEFPYRIKMHNYIHSVVHGIPLRELEDEDASVLPESLVTEVPPELIDKIIKQVPAAERWIPAIIGKLNENRNGFFAWFKKATNNELGGKPKGKQADVKGDVLNVVSNFITEELESQSTYPQQPSLLLDSSQQIMFWDDPQAWEIIRNAVPPNFQAKIREDLVWIQGRLKDPTNTHYRPFNERTNSMGILSFNKYLKKYHMYLGDNVIKTIASLLSNRYP